MNCLCGWWERVFVAVHGQSWPIKILSSHRLCTVCNAMSWGQGPKYLITLETYVKPNMFNIWVKH